MLPSNAEISDADSDDAFSEDMEALKRTFHLTGADPIGHRFQRPSTTRGAAGGVGSVGAVLDVESDEEEEEDLELVRRIQKRFAISTGKEEERLQPKPLCTLPPEWSDSDDCDDDYETLRAIQRRFASYNEDASCLKVNVEDSLHRPVQPFDLLEWDGPGADDVAGLQLESSHFPKPALAFVDAIKKNRSCQKLIRSKMLQMEARIEELKKLTDRVQILKDFQIVCKRKTGQALSQKRDARVQLISTPKLRARAKLNGKIHASYKGPPENPQVANYRTSLETFPIFVGSKKWSKEEKQNLVKGVKQQFQGMLLQRSVDLLSDADGSYDSSNVDSIIVSIKDIDITPDKMRLFLPKVNWDELAAMYVPGRSGVECQSRFLNFEDPLINHKSWTAAEDKNLLHIVQQRGLNNWIDIAASLGTNRTPFQCLARYQRSLNASILKREWTKEEDNQLRAAVETFGEGNWQLVASMIEGRTGTQCSNRWMKTLHPARLRVGHWTAEEDKRLKVAVTLYGPKTWQKVARCVPGRTQVQCRERWANCLDPSLNMAEWTGEEDSKLEAAIAEHGYCWSKVAACIPRRTDNQCWRRWKVLFPDEVHLHQAARKIQRAALISNFVDRETERPALGPSDFIMPESLCIAGCDDVEHASKKTRRSRQGKSHQRDEEYSPHSEICSEEVEMSTNGNEVENSTQTRSFARKGRFKTSRSIKKDSGPPSYGLELQYPDAVSLDAANVGGIRKSRASDGNHKRRPKIRKKSGVKSKSGAVPTPRVICNHRMGANENKKVPKLSPRRRHGEMLEELLEALPGVDAQVGEATILMTKKEKKKWKKRIHAANDHISSFPDSMLLMEAFCRIRARRQKRKTRDTCSSGECVPQLEIALPFRSNTDIAVSGMPSERENARYRVNATAPSETEEESATLASLFFRQSYDEGGHVPEDKVGKLHRKAKRNSLVQIGLRAGDLSVCNQSKKRSRDETNSCQQMVGVEAESRNDNKVCQNRASESEVPDDTTLAHLYNQLKRRRTKALPR